MQVSVRAGVSQSPAEIYDLAADANRAVHLYDLGLQEGFDREQYDDGDGTFYVVVTAEADRILPLLAPIVDSGVAPYYVEWNPASAGPAGAQLRSARARADELWEVHGPQGSGAIYEMEEE